MPRKTSKPSSAGQSKPSAKTGVDPYADREAKKYDHPIASRELILQLLKEAGKPLDEAKIAKSLHIRPDQEIPLMRRLRAMIRDGQLIKNRRGAFAIVDKLDLVRGRIIGHKDGFGFFKPDPVPDSKADLDDYFVSPRQMRMVFDGDIVLIRLRGFTRKGQKEAHIVEVLERAHESIVGRVHLEQEYCFVIPDNKRISQQVAIPRKGRGKAKEGQMVSVEILSPPRIDALAVGQITEVLGEHLAPGMEIDVAIRAHDIPAHWPTAVEKEIGTFDELVSDDDKKHRVDLRHLPFVTIDGEDARDFDDAVYAEKGKGGAWRLWVAIADVSHYVKPDSALDQEADKRATSVYFPGQVVPMLPELLSNGLCSLNPNTDRLCMVCEMTVSAAGKVSSYTFYEGVFQSHARLTYTQVGEFLESGSLQNKKLHEPLRNLEGVYRTLRGAREIRGAMDFDSHETQIIFGDDRKIERIVPVVRNEAHKLIEECMLAANVSAALFLQSAELPAVYRVHQGPSGDKLANLSEFLSELGLSLGGSTKPDPREYHRLSKEIEGRADAHIIKTMMLRSMSQAAYQVENEGHFGLAYTAYTHFTSPIRRYPDLLVHRAIRSVIRSRKANDNVQRVRGAKVIAKKAIYPYDVARLLTMAEHCSMAERRADEATRDVVAFLKCEYLQDRIGEVFEGTVNAVTGFGLFVELDNIYVEGLVHVTALNNDYYHFDVANQRLQGERTGASFRLADKMTVRLVAVNIDDRKIDLELVEGGVKGRRNRPASKKAPGVGAFKGKEGERNEPSRSAKNKKRKGGKKRSKAKLADKSVEPKKANVTAKDTDKPVEIKKRVVKKRTVKKTTTKKAPVKKTAAKTEVSKVGKKSAKKSIKKVVKKSTAKVAKKVSKKVSNGVVKKTVKKTPKKTTKQDRNKDS